MYTDVERTLLSLDARKFPLLAAAQHASRGCGRCGHANVNVHAMLRTALTRYRNDKQFKEWLAQHVGLPLTAAGITIDRV